MLASSLLMTEAYALEIPVSQVEQMIDGRQTITQVFEVSPDVAPESLIQEEIIQHGYRFTMTSITKEAVLVEDEKEITQEQSIVVNVSDADKARLEALLSMPAFIEYDEEGYVGKLYPVVSSLSGRETGRSNHSGYNTVTKSYTFDYNDDSLVPTSNNGYALSSISWSEGEYMDDSGIPENYVATATYRKGYSYSTVDGWEYTMSYVGDVTFKREVRKNLVTGEEIYGAWGMEKITFPEYEVPKVENYIPIMDKVEAAVVTPDTQNWTVDIYYEAATEVTTEYNTVKRVISIYQDGKKVE